MLSNSKMNFNIVIITDWKDRIKTFSCDNIKAYKEELTNTPDMC